MSLASLVRRKQVRIRLRSDLEITSQQYEGRPYYVVRDPVSLRYHRLSEREYFLVGLLNGNTTVEEARQKYEERFRPDRLLPEEMESFLQQLLKSGLAEHDSALFGDQLFERQQERRWRQWLQVFTNILYIKIPLFNPERLLNWMLGYLRWVFTRGFLAVSVLVVLSAVLLVAMHFETIRAKLPASQEFFSARNLLTMWIALGIVKVIHEFGHGLSCRALGGEVHEMGALFLCLSPCLYCNVSDSWMLPNKWHRIVIGGAGIYVELLIAALATFVWLYSASDLWINQLALSLMVVCSISTVVFNANPLMRFDGYYMLGDWLEIPNLRERCNQYLSRLVQEHGLGVEDADLPAKPDMEPGRRVLFVAYTVGSYVYRWVVTVGVIWFLTMFLKPYKLESIGAMMALAAVASMIGWPLYRLGHSLHERGRLPNMKTQRVALTACLAALLVLAFFTVPLPVSRVRQLALVEVEPGAAVKVHVPITGDRTPGSLARLHVRDGQSVSAGLILAEFRNLALEIDLQEARTLYEVQGALLREAEDQLVVSRTEARRGKLQSEIARAKGERDRQAARVKELERVRAQLVLRAPRSGVVMSPPAIDEIGKQWDRERTTPFCSIGDPQRLRVLMPVSPADYDLLKNAWRQAEMKGSTLDVDIRVHGRDARIWKGRIAQLPESEAKEVPLGLTTRAGGPVAARPATNHAGSYLPQAQQFLVAIEILDPDDAICPGVLAQVKVHCPWRSCAWWVWRALSSTFDLSLF